MKKCQRCTKPATLHITEIEEGDVAELHLCESCAQTYLNSGTPGSDEFGDPDIESISDKVTDSTSQEELEHIDQMSCDQCELTFKEFRSRGRLGCPYCYTSFHDELLPLLENIHCEAEHIGKYPKRAPQASQQQFRLIQLRNRLRTAVDDEDYESAARLRDEISQLETDLAGASSEVSDFAED